MGARMVLPILSLLAATACCRPDSCPPARQGFALLAPATSAILSGAPSPGPALEATGLQPTFGGWTFTDGRGREVSVSWDATRRELSFAYDVPGRNICTWTARTTAWACSGYD